MPRPTPFFAGQHAARRTLCASFVVALLASLGATAARGQENTPPPPAPTAGIAPGGTPHATIERIAALEQDLAADDAQLRKLQKELAAHLQQYDEAIREFNQLKSDSAAKQRERDQLSPDETEKIEAVDAELASLQARLDLAREGIELAIAERRAVQGLIAQLERKIAQDRQVLDRLHGVPAAEPTTPEKTPPPETAPAPPSELLPGVAAPEAPAPAPPEALSPRVAEAETIATRKKAAATAARQSKEEIEQRRQVIEEGIELEQTRLVTSYRRYDNQRQQMMQLESELFRELSAGKDYADLTDLAERRDKARERLQPLREEIDSHHQRIQQLQGQLLGLQQEQLLAAEELKQRELEAQAALRDRWLITISDFAIVAVPKIIGVLLLMFLLYFLARAIGRRVIPYWSKTERGTEEERQNRAETLVSVFENAAKIAIYSIGAVTILDILRVPVGTLLGGVAVIGLAVAFGAQNLIRDYFYGFMILLENQYKINDVVTIGGMTGKVERITLRITVLRDFEGLVYFIPNGQINSVTNLTHEWARVVLDIGVAYKEKVERVMSVLLELAQELVQEPAFASGVLQEPELFGVERLDDSSVVVRLCLVVRPFQRHTVRREMLRRIKSRFDELGIEIPFPQRTVHYRPLIDSEGESIRLGAPTNGASRASPAVEEA